MSLLFFLQGIPETIGVIALSLVLARIPIRWGPVILAGTLVSIISSIIRALPVTLGIHTIALLLLSVFFISKATRISTARSFITVISSVIALIFLEVSIHALFFKITKLNPQTIPPDSIQWTLLGMPQAIIMIILALLIPKILKPVSNGWKI